MVLINESNINRLLYSLHQVFKYNVITLFYCHQSSHSKTIKMTKYSRILVSIRQKKGQPGQTHTLLIFLEIYLTLEWYWNVKCQKTHLSCLTLPLRRCCAPGGGHRGVVGCRYHSLTTSHCSVGRGGRGAAQAPHCCWCPSGRPCCGSAPCRSGWAGLRGPADRRGPESWATRRRSAPAYCPAGSPTNSASTCGEG